ncbi:hypothetical protein LJR030_000526 [Rhizobium sp. LjRoot30]|uniref:hypothetical protein n=1 Tax=Rhizobium sp. LjRoot30 TaxID=3342320 RepID=UPI003ECD139D
MLEPPLNLASRLIEHAGQQGTLESRIAAYLRMRSGVTVIELMRDIPGFTGDKTWVFADQNIVIWPYVSEAAILAMTSLIASDKVKPTPTSWLVYNFDGQILDMPTATRIKRYNEPHWLPIVFAGNKEVIDGEG